MTQQLELWRGPFGDNYQDRNIHTEEEMSHRERFWNHLLRCMYVQSGALPVSVLEIGAGQGPNLVAIRDIYSATGKRVELYATEVNDKAKVKLVQNIETVNLLTSVPHSETMDLVFTYGVMIHTHPGHVMNLIDSMFKASNKWIMACEYFAPQTRPMPYRGEEHALWLDDYGSKFLNHFPVRLAAYGFAWKPATGLDNITYWLFEKARKMT